MKNNGKKQIKKANNKKSFLYKCVMWSIWGSLLGIWTGLLSSTYKDIVDIVTKPYFCSPIMIMTFYFGLFTFIIWILFTIVIFYNLIDFNKVKKLINIYYSDDEIDDNVNNQVLDSNYDNQNYNNQYYYDDYNNYGYGQTNPYNYQQQNYNNYQQQNYDNQEPKITKKDLKKEKKEKKLLEKQLKKENKKKEKNEVPINDKENLGYKKSPLFSFHKNKNFSDNLVNDFNKDLNQSSVQPLKPECYRGQIPSSNLNNELLEAKAEIPSTTTELPTPRIYVKEGQYIPKGYRFDEKIMKFVKIDAEINS